MSMAILIIGLISAGLALAIFLLDCRKPNKAEIRIKRLVVAFLFFAGIALAVLGYLSSEETESQITEIRTPRRMEPETKRMLAARVKPHAGQKYDMMVFRDDDSLELATAIQTILEEEGWVHTKVYPKNATRRYAETSDHGLWLMSGKEETTRTSEARMALHGALNEAGLYDDSAAFTPENCVESTGPPQAGTKVTPIPCSESPIQGIEIDFTIPDDVIPEDTLALHVGKARP